MGSSPKAPFLRERARLHPTSPARRLAVLLWVLFVSAPALAPRDAAAADPWTGHAAIVGLAGRETELLRRTIPVVIPLVIAAGVVALVLVNI